MITSTGENSWYNMIREGATACMEAWGKDKKDNTSLCHPWSSAPVTVLIEDLLSVSYDGTVGEPHIPKTVGYLKKAGFSLAEITVVMEAASEEERRLLMSERMEQTQKQMKRLKERMSMMEWLTSQNPAPEAGHESYRIHQKQMDSRRVWMTETAKPCDVEDFYRQTGVLMAEEMADFQKMRGYLLEETAFMEGKKLAIEGSFISGGDCVSAEKNQSILPKGNYICMTTAIFREDKWIRALSRYFAEKDMRPRIILAVLKHKDFYNWRHSLYEVQILV